MATIDYKQKIKDYMNSSEVDTLYKSMLKNLFPELKESEDERIRKALIEHFNFSDKNVYYEINGIPHKKVIAWLEKQGQTFTKKDVDDAYLKGICDAKHELEKQGEQKPTDEEMIALLRTEYEKGRADAIAEMQKSWSEEDERKIELLKSLIEDAKGDSTSYSTMFREMEELNNWLKSLKNRVLPQSRQEWSEDDENRINRLIAYFEDKESFTAEDDIVYANWFKSLKDRYTWKPSDEQMGVIEAVINNRSFQRRHLDSLYEQLKKLKG